MRRGDYLSDSSLYNGYMPVSSDKLYTARQVRGLDHAAIHDLGIEGFELMQRAGRAVSDAAFEHFPAARHWLILCGPGNNGGDGYVVASLALQAGVDVTVCALSDPQNLQGDAARAYSAWQQAGGSVFAWPLRSGEVFELAFDALLGTGIGRAVEGDYRQAIAFLNRLECPKIAIDIPSGLNADSGRFMGCCTQADLSVTFVGRKRGMYTADGPDCCGQILFDDLAVPSGAAKSVGRAGRLLREEFLAETISSRKRNAHKGNFGHVLAVGGLQGMSGAIRLCGEAALRSGAGRVTLATDPAHAAFVNIDRPELMVSAVAAASELQAILSQTHVVAVGPGLGRSAWSRALLQTCIGSGLTLVVDADGLNLLADEAAGGQLPVRDNWVLTPHPGEAAHLLACSTHDIQQDRVAAALTLARRYAATVVLKGCGSIIADPLDNYSICPFGNPGMATAGSGDVLTGMIAALLGQGLDCSDAATVGVLAHALAGDEAAARLGETALLAGDLVESLAAIWTSAWRHQAHGG